MKAAGKVDKAKEAAAAEEEEAKPSSFDKKKKDIWGGEVAEDIELDPTKLKDALRKEVGPAQVDFRFGAPPQPILGNFGKVESDFWVILLIQRALFWVQGYLWYRVYIGGSFCRYDLD